MPTDTLQSIPIELGERKTLVVSQPETTIVVQQPAKAFSVKSYIPFINYDNHHLTCNLNN